MSDLVAESAGRLFADWKARAIAVLPRDAEQQEIPLIADLWSQVEEQGFPLALLSEAEGGFGLDPQSAWLLPGLAAEHGVALPLGETMVARLIAARCGLDLPESGVVTFGLMDPASAGQSTRLGWARHAVAAVLLEDSPAGARIAAVDPAAQTLLPGRNILCEPRDRLQLGVVEWQPSALSGDEVRALGALLRAVGIAGASRTVLALCLEYARQRQQFGKPLGRFQVIQHNLAMMASQAAAAGAAAGGAVRAFGAWAAGECPAPEFVLHAGAAKLRAGEAGGLIAAQAQQLHGAIGITHEFPLHVWTRRLWSWRDEFGAESHWADHIGQAALAAPALWPFLTDLGEVTT